MNTCGDRRLRPGATGLLTRAREGACGVSCGGRHLGFEKLGGIDVLRGDRIHVRRNRRSRALPGGPSRGVRGFECRLAGLLKRQRRTSPRTRKRTSVGAIRPEAGAVPSSTGVAGGRIAARRSGVDPEPTGGDARIRDRPRSRTLAVPTTARGQESPEAAVQASARDVNVDCRSGVEASWRRLRGKAVRPYEQRSRSEGRGPRSGRDWRSSDLAKGCSGSAKVERQARSPE